ncbi:MAG: hypothetical protein NTY41_00180 [Proteobacteria bacterium]|nr:hypothetical protein [Pseudomonadota bacterium]
MARWGRIGQAIRDFSDSYKLTRGLTQDFAMANAAKASPETIETQRPGAETTPNQDNMVYDSDTGTMVPKYMNGDQPTEQAQAQLNPAAGRPDVPTDLQPDQPSVVPDTPVRPTFATETSTQYRMGDKTQSQPFTDDQIQQSRFRHMGTVAANFGDPIKSANYDALASDRQRTADQEEIRNTLKSAQSQPGLQRGSYLDAISPQIADTLLRQGNVAGAKMWRDFAESEQGRVYADDFAKAQRLVTAGSYDDAMPILQRIHDRDLPNGRNAKLTNLGGGQWQADVVDQRTGQVLGSKVMGAADLAKSAVNALQPTKMVEFMAQQQGKREAEGATLDRQVIADSRLVAGPRCPRIAATWRLTRRARR